MPTPRAFNAIGLSLALAAGSLALTAACSSGGGGPGGNGTGGVSATGGASSTGGATATGGRSGTGGSTSTGGTAATGGAGQTGGSSSTGGAKTGGSSGTGGNASTGGAIATGGQAGGAGQGGAKTGGTGGGSTATGGAAGGSSGGCIICDDFESGTTLDANKWVIDASMGAAVGKAEIVSGGAHGSGKAVKVSGGYIKVDAKAGLFAGVSSHFFMRMNMKFDMAQPSGHVTYLMLADKTKSGQLRLGAQNGGMIWNYDPGDSILPDYNAAASSLKPGADEWHCFEFEIDGAAPVMRVWMDGTEATQMLLDGTPTSGIDDRWMRDMPGWKPSITNFSFGEGYPTGTISTWFDDIAIANSRIGCKF